MGTRDSIRAGTPEGARRRVRFGAFEVDFDRGEVRKAGTRLRLPGQAFEFLQALLERPGELVTREELRQRIWTDDTFVDFDHGLNVMVNRLREVLGDSARSPYYIETVPRKGYRFIAPLTPGEPAAPDAEPIAPQTPPLSRQRRSQGGWWTWLVAASILAAVSLAAWRVWTPLPTPDVFPITTFAGSKDFAAFSPDGAMIAFTWVGPQGQVAQSRDVSRNRDIYVKLVDAGAPLRLTAAPEDELLPAWSPDGRHVAFLRKEGARTFVYLVPALGGTERKVCEAGIGLAWSPDGKTLAIAGPPDAKSRTAIVLHSLASGAQRQLTRPEPYSDSFPAYSPDGQKLAFVSRRTGSEEIWVSDPRGEGPMQVTAFGGPGTGSPRWSPDGKWIAFDSRARGSADLYVVGADGGGLRQLTQGPEEDMMPAWSSDGRWLYFVSGRGGAYQVWKMPAAGGAAVQVTRHGAYECVESPDGKLLYFTKGRAVPGIWSLSLTSGEETLAPELSQAGYWRSWGVTRQGVYFAAKGETEGAHVVRLYRFSTRQVTTLATLAKEPLWLQSGLALSQDGGQLLVAQLDQAVNDLMLIENFR